MTPGWDIFCRVVDNYGDVGVAWRLARQLSAEHGIAVRLWIDQPAALARLWPQVDPALEAQQVAGVEVCHWGAQSAADSAQPPAVVIEAFACEPPAAYVARMAQMPRPPAWINLDYLSAEPWVDGHHGLHSPHPRLPLTRHFFFPGFTAATGGLLREGGLIAARDAFQDDALAQSAFWESLGLAPRCAGELRVSLFCYENPALAALFDAWSAGAQPVTCLVPEGRIVPQVAEFFAGTGLHAGARLVRGNLTVRVLPFTDQPGYDRLLWACDWNFVRGEDSFVRAQWAAQPFVWHIYPQAEAAHHAKLTAFWQRYSAALAPDIASAMGSLWRGWNGIEPADWLADWELAAGQAQMLADHAVAWARNLASTRDLASQLVEFAGKVAN